MVFVTCFDNMQYVFHDKFLLQKYSGQHEDMTLQDMYNKEGDFDDEDDSDWDPLETPLEKHITIVKWFCVNCTMVNFDDAIYCHVWSCQLLS